MTSRKPAPFLDFGYGKEGVAVYVGLKDPFRGRSRVLRQASRRGNPVVKKWLCFRLSPLGKHFPKTTPDAPGLCF